MTDALQVWVNEKRFTFTFNQSLVSVGTLTWHGVWSVIWVNGCVIYQNSWQEHCVQNCLKNQQTESVAPAYCLQHCWQKQWICPWHSKEHLLLVILVLCMVNDWFQGLSLPYVIQTNLFVQQWGVLDRCSTQTTWSIGTQKIGSKNLKYNQCL